MAIQIPEDELKKVLSGALSGALSAEQQLDASSQSQVATLVNELYPLVLSETQAQAAATNPTVPQTYLQILEGIVAAAIARLGLQGLETQRGVLAGILHITIQVIVLVLKAAA